MNYPLCRNINSELYDEKEKACNEFDRWLGTRDADDEGYSYGKFYSSGQYLEIASDKYLDAVEEYFKIRRIALPSRLRDEDIEKALEKYEAYKKKKAHLLFKGQS